MTRTQMTGIGLAGALLVTAAAREESNPRASFPRESCSAWFRRKACYPPSLRLP